MITASLPTPLGPLTTRIKGFGGGKEGAELKVDPNVASSPLYNVAYHSYHVSFKTWTKTCKNIDNKKEYTIKTKCH